MKVTRAVVEDLLPLYLAGEASDDTRALVEAYMKEDPEFARLAGEAARCKLPEGIPPQWTKEEEMKSLQRTKRIADLRSWLMGAAIFFSLLPLSVMHTEATGFRWLVASSPTALAGTLATAAAIWAVYLALGRRLR